MTDLAITPDFSKLVAIGMYDMPLTLPPAGGVTAVSDGASGGTATPPTGSNAPAAANRPAENRIIVYDLLTKQLETYVPPPEILLDILDADSVFLGITTGRLRWRES